MSLILGLFIYRLILIKFALQSVNLRDEAVDLDVEVTLHLTSLLFERSHSLLQSGLKTGVKFVLKTTLLYTQLVSFL